MTGPRTAPPPSFLFVALALTFATPILPGAVAGQAPSVLSLLPTEGRRLTPDQGQTGALSASDYRGPSDSHLEAWELAGQAGSSVTVDLSSEEFDPILYVVGPGFGETLYDDDSGGGCGARLAVTFLESGTFTVIVSSLDSSGRGTYTLLASTQPLPAPRYACGEPDPALLEALPTEGRSLSMGVAAAGALSPFSPSLGQGRPLEAWSLSGTPGERVSVVLESDAFDAFLYAVDPDGGPVLTDDDGAGGLHSRLDFTMTSGRPWIVIASSISEGASGGYRIRVEAPLDLATLETEGRTIRPGDTAEGFYSDVGPALIDGRGGQGWALELEAGATVTVDLRSEEFDAFLWVAGPGLGEPLADDDGGGDLNSRITFTAPSSGSYRIVVSALGGGASGSFTLSVREE